MISSDLSIATDMVSSSTLYLLTMFHSKAHFTIKSDQAAYRKPDDVAKLNTRYLVPRKKCSAKKNLVQVKLIDTPLGERLVEFENDKVGL